MMRLKILAILGDVAEELVGPEVNPERTSPTTPEVRLSSNAKDLANEPQTPSINHNMANSFASSLPLPLPSNDSTAFGVPAETSAVGNTLETYEGTRVCEDAAVDPLSNSAPPAPGETLGPSSLDKFAQPKPLGSAKDASISPGPTSPCVMGDNPGTACTVSVDEQLPARSSGESATRTDSPVASVETAPKSTGSKRRVPEDDVEVGGTEAKRTKREDVLPRR